MRSPEEAKAEFTKRGLSIRGWAIANGFSPTLVYQVLSGKRENLRGKSHQIAVLLGLKNGIISDMDNLPFEITDYKEK